MPRKSYIICAVQRSGSTLLCEALQNTGLAGNPAEHFILWLRKIKEQDHGLTQKEVFDDFIDQGIGPNQVFGTKMMWSYCKDTITKMKEVFQVAGNNPSDLQVLREVLPNPKFIFLVRRNVVRQAISLYKTEKTRLHHIMNDEQHQRLEQLNETLIFDPTKISNYHRYVSQHQARWEEFFEENNIRPYRVVYEDFVQSYEETALRLLRFLDIPYPENLTLKPRKMRPLADNVTEKWEAEYEGMLSNIKNHVRKIKIKDIPSNAEIYLFGAGEAGHRAYRAIKTKRPGVQVNGFIDNRKTGALNGVRIYHIDELANEPGLPGKIVLASFYWLEISLGLIEKGLSGFNLLLD
ncbi:MAG: hypothetical protein GY940_21695 [bacterium]|nr:hypothetical protein [bacterium]